MDIAFENASSVLCIGYGFNDKHIHPKLIQRISNDKLPMIILARTLSKNAKIFINNSSYDDVIGIEAHKSGSKIIRSKNHKFETENCEFWQLSEFNKLII